MSRRNKITLSVYVDPAQAEALRLLSEATDVPVAVYIRRGIDRVLRLHAEEIEDARERKEGRG